MKFHLLTLTGLAMILAVATMFDYLTAATLILTFKAIIALLAASFVIVMWRLTGKKIQLIYLAVFFFCLVVLRGYQASPVKPFRQFYLDLQPGLTQPEIGARLQSHFPQGGKYKQPSTALVGDNLMVVILDPNDGRYDAEVVHIVFRDGRLKSAAYYPD